MRADTALIFKKLTGLYNEKKSLFVQIADHCRFQSSLLNSEDFSAISDSINENTHLISVIDSIDYEISAALDKLLHITGMDKKTLETFLAENNENETRALQERKNECTAALKTASVLFNDFLDAAQTKAKGYTADIQELERIIRVKEFL